MKFRQQQQRLEEEQKAAAEAAKDKTNKKKKKKKSEQADKGEEGSAEEIVSLTAPFITALRGTDILAEMVYTLVCRSTPSTLATSILRKLFSIWLSSVDIVACLHQREKEKKRERIAQRKAAAEAAEEQRRLALSQLVVKETEDEKARSPTNKDGSPSSSPPKGDRSSSTKPKKSPAKGDRSSSGKK